MKVDAAFSVLCSCGRATPFTDDLRGQIFVCACGQPDLIPWRASGLARFGKRIAWAWRWISAGSRRRRGAATRPYRDAAVNVACPACSWRPQPDERWQCDLCHCTWNTFTTRGQCPGCAFRFPATGCFSCHALTRHEDWYQG